MEKKLNLGDKLDFSEIDLTAPDKVIKEILSQLPEVTADNVWGEIEHYDGNITSYTKSSIYDFSSALVGEKKVDIQTELGVSGNTEYRYECYLYSKANEFYKYRMFFVQYNIAKYPVKLVLERSIAESISPATSGYIFHCNNREELEELVERILTSKRVISIMQEIIRVNQSAKYDEQETE